jgi:hypothetical protein
MRSFLLLLILMMGCANEGDDCLGDPLQRLFVPELGACVDVSNADGCQECVTSRCIVGSPDGLAGCGGPCAGADEAT